MSKRLFPVGRRQRQRRRRRRDCSGNLILLFPISFREGNVSGFNGRKNTGLSIPDRRIVATGMNGEKARSGLLIASFTFSRMFVYALLSFLKRMPLNTKNLFKKLH